MSYVEKFVSSHLFSNNVYIYNKHAIFPQSFKLVLEKKLYQQRYFIFASTVDYIYI